MNKVLKGFLLIALMTIAGINFVSCKDYGNKQDEEIVVKENVSVTIYKNDHVGGLETATGDFWYFGTCDFQVRTNIKNPANDSIFDYATHNLYVGKNLWGAFQTWHGDVYTECYATGNETPLADYLLEHDPGVFIIPDYAY
jgi:hypothetical protein